MADESAMKVFQKVLANQGLRPDDETYQAMVKEFQILQNDLSHDKQKSAEKHLKILQEDMDHLRSLSNVAREAHKSTERARTAGPTLEQYKDIKFREPLSVYGKDTSRTGLQKPENLETVSQNISDYLESMKDHSFFTHPLLRQGPPFSVEDARKPKRHVPSLKQQARDKELTGNTSYLTEQLTHVGSLAPKKHLVKVGPSGVKVTADRKKVADWVTGLAGLDQSFNQRRNFAKHLGKVGRQIVIGPDGTVVFGQKHQDALKAPTMTYSKLAAQVSKRQWEHHLGKLRAPEGVSFGPKMDKKQRALAFRKGLVSVGNESETLWRQWGNKSPAHKLTKAGDWWRTAPLI